MGQPLRAIAAAKPSDLDLAFAAINLERKQVFPLRAARVQEGRLIGRRPQDHEAVVIDRHVPEIGMGRSLDLDEVTQNPTGEIDQVWPLVDELAAARSPRIGAPFPVVAQPSAMAVPAAQVHEGTPCAESMISRALRKAR